MTRISYTRLPRPILWLIPGGEVQLEAGSGAPLFRSVKSFYISKQPVTNQQIEAFDSSFDRAACSSSDHDPAVGVSFEMARDYCAWYASVTRKPMRLPTAIEWEYACRAEAEGRRCFGEERDQMDEYVWHRGNAGEQVPRLNAKKANGFGLFGMLGGVWEWTASSDEEESPNSDFGQDSVDWAVARGGSFRTLAQDIVCSAQRFEESTARFDDIGFRVAKSFVDPPARSKKLSR